MKHLKTGAAAKAENAPLHGEGTNGGRQLPDGVIDFTLAGAAVSKAEEVLAKVKLANTRVEQIVQLTHGVRGPKADPNGIREQSVIELRQQYSSIQSRRDDGDATYMNNKALVEVINADLMRELYEAIPCVRDDVLWQYPLFYTSDNPKSTSDVLMGSVDSWSALHQDLPLYTNAAVLVLEGEKQFVVMPTEVADIVHEELGTAISPDLWDKPFLGHRSLVAYIEAHGGKCFTLTAMRMLLIPPRVFHFARNLGPTVSCNFSYCAMADVPEMISRTFEWMRLRPQDDMKFDVDFARLLVACTRHVLLDDPTLPQPATGASTTAASRKRALNGSAAAKQNPSVLSQLLRPVRGCSLPDQRAVSRRILRLAAWYGTLLCIPMGWVKQYYGSCRDHLLAALLQELASPLKDVQVSVAKGGHLHGGYGTDGGRQVGQGDMHGNPGNDNKACEHVQEDNGDEDEDEEAQGRGFVRARAGSHSLDHADGGSNGAHKRSREASQNEQLGRGMRGAPLRKRPMESALQ